MDSSGGVHGGVEIRGCLVNFSSSTGRQRRLGLQSWLAKLVRETWRETWCETWFTRALNLALRSVEFWMNENRFHTQFHARLRRLVFLHIESFTLVFVSTFTHVFTTSFELSLLSNFVAISPGRATAWPRPHRGRATTATGRDRRASRQHKKKAKFMATDGSNTG